MRTRLLLLALLALPAVGSPRPAEAQASSSEAGWIGVDAGLVMTPGVRPVMVVRQVAVGSPAAQAGLAPGDTLVALDGMPPTFARFQALRGRLRPGDPLELTVRNGQKPRTLVVHAARRPADGPNAPRPSSASVVVTETWMTPYLIGQDRVAGARVAALNAGLAQYFGTERGLLVIEVAPGTPAAAARLLPGDVLLRAGGVVIDELPSLRRAVADARPDRALSLIVIRRGREVEITLPR